MGTSSLLGCVEAGLLRGSFFVALVVARGAISGTTGVVVEDCCGTGAGDRAASGCFFIGARALTGLVSLACVGCVMLGSLGFRPGFDESGVWCERESISGSFCMLMDCGSFLGRSTVSIVSNRGS